MLKPTFLWHLGNQEAKSNIKFSSNDGHRIQLKGNRFFSNNNRKCLDESKPHRWRIMVIVVASSAVDRGIDGVKPKAMKLVFVASQLSMQL